MKRFIYYLFACVATLGLLSSCDKEEEERDNTYLPEYLFLKSSDLTLEEKNYKTYACEVSHETGTYHLTFDNEVLHPEQVSTTHLVTYISYNLGEEYRDWASVEIHNEGATTDIEVTLNKNPISTEARHLTLNICALYNGIYSTRDIDISQQAAPPPPQNYKVFDVDYTLTANSCRIHDGKYNSTITVPCNLNYKETLTFITLDDSEKAYLYFLEDNTYDPYDDYYLDTEGDIFSSHYINGECDIWMKEEITGFPNLHGTAYLLNNRVGGSLRFWTCNHCTCQEPSLEQNYTYIIIDFYNKNSDGTNADLITNVTRHNERTINVTKPTITKKEGPSIPEHCTHYVDTGGDDDEQGGNVQTGTTTAVVSVTTNYWDAWLEFIQGKSFQVEWKYYPNTGKYYFYGGPYCQDPEANGGKGVLYECHKGYNNIEICRGKDYYGSFWSTWYVYAKFTI